MRNEFLLGWRGQGSSLDATFICEGSGNVCGCSDTHELISVCIDLWKNVPCQKGLATMRRSRCLYEFVVCEGSGAGRNVQSALCMRGI